MDLDTPLLGNDRVRARLWKAADEGRMHHAYLFEGPEGVGKHTAAIRLALYANCLAEGGRPCGACASCRQMLAGSHPDLLVVGPDPERATRVITVAQAHAVIGALQLHRHSARRRFVIVDPADALNEESANALLKTLEEPPQGTQFVLVTARAASLLPTIRSRAQRVRFGAVREVELAPWLAARGLPPALAAAAQGSPGLALRLAEREAEERREARDALLGAVGQPIHRLFSFTEAWGKKEEGAGSRADRVLDALEELLRDVALVAAGREARVLHADRLPLLRAWAAALWPAGLARMSRALATARDRAHLNVNGRVVLEALLSALNVELRGLREAG